MIGRGGGGLRTEYDKIGLFPVRGVGGIKKNNYKFLFT